MKSKKAAEKVYKPGETVNHKWLGKCTIIEKVSIDQNGYVVQVQKKEAGQHDEVNDWDFV